MSTKFAGPQALLRTPVTDRGAFGGENNRERVVHPFADQQTGEG